MSCQTIRGHLDIVFRPLTFCVALLIIAGTGVDGIGQDIPVLTDGRLQLQLFAEAPDIVTPIGMVIDRQDRIYVIESHTHLLVRGLRSSPS